MLLVYTYYIYQTLWLFIMLERRNALRVSSDIIKMHLQDTEVEVKDISLKGARIHMPSQGFDGPDEGICTIVINYSHYKLAYSIHERSSDELIIYFSFPEEAMMYQFQKTLKNIHMHTAQ